MTDAPVLVLDDNDSPTVVVVQNDLLRYLFADDDEETWRVVVSLWGLPPWCPCDRCGNAT